MSEGLDSKLYLHYLKQLLEEPDARKEIMKVILGSLEVPEAGEVLSGPVLQWLGGGAPIGTTTAASYISWLGSEELSPMKWTIQSSLISCCASHGIHSFRKLDDSKALGMLGFYGNRLNNLLRLSKTSSVEDFLAPFIEILQEFGEHELLSVPDSVELLDALFSERATPFVVVRTLSSVLKNIRFYVEGKGRDWPVHPGNVRAMRLEIKSRVVILLLKKMILADDEIEPREMYNFYTFIGKQYCISPQQGEWIFDEAPVDFDLQQLADDMKSMMTADTIKEVMQSLETMAMADEVLDEREADLLKTLKAYLN